MPKLSVILVGDDPASVMYARSPERACKKSGNKHELITFPSDARKEESVLQELERLSVDQSCHGIMVETSPS